MILSTIIMALVAVIAAAAGSDNLLGGATIGGAVAGVGFTGLAWWIILHQAAELKETRSDVKEAVKALSTNTEVVRTNTTALEGQAKLQETTNSLLGEIKGLMR